jgi:hypothetical protein
MKKSEPLKADWIGRRSKGGHQFGAGPGGKELPGKNH